MMAGDLAGYFLGREKKVREGEGERSAEGKSVGEGRNKVSKQNYLKCP